MKPKTIIQYLLVLILSVFFTSVSAQHHHKSKNHNPHYKYSNMPHWGYHYKVAPQGAYLVPHSGGHYYYRGGIFYRPSGTNYVIARAPLGVRVKVLPTGYVRFIAGGRTYFYYYGTYYVFSDNNEYVTVAPPVGAIVDALPDGYKKVNIDGKTYYLFEGTYYKAVLDKSGDVWYEVVGDR